MRVKQEVIVLVTLCNQVCSYLGVVDIAPISAGLMEFTVINVSKVPGNFITPRPNGRQISTRTLIGPTFGPA
jgi:hypothetical protein